MIEIPERVWRSQSLHAIANKLSPVHQVQFWRIAAYCKLSARRYAYLILHPEYLPSKGSKDAKLATPLKPSRKYTRKERRAKK